MVNRKWQGKHVFLYAQKMAHSIARKNAGQGVDPEELAQDIAERLLKARKRYDPAKHAGVSLHAYMIQSANYAVRDSFRGGFTFTDYKLIRRTNEENIRIYTESYDTSEAVDDSAEKGTQGASIRAFQLAATFDTIPLEEETDEEIRNAFIEDLFSCLNEREEKIMRQIYCENKTGREVAELEGVTESRVAQIKERAIYKCRRNSRRAA